MKRKAVAPPQPYLLVGLAGLAFIISAMVSIGVLYAVRKSKQMTANGAAHASFAAASNGNLAGTPVTPPIQPAVTAQMAAHVPDHFSEELIVPGFTETGQDIERQDEEHGRSPEGV